MGSVHEWLNSIGLGDYAGAFDEHAIGWDVLPQLDHNLLKDIGVARAGDRVRILNAIQGHLTRSAGGAAGTAVLTPSRAPANRPERRQLTVLYCDLVGSTALAARLDPENLRDLIRAYQEACQSAIVRYEGFVARFFGDGMLAYFGYPQAHEESAERAVRAGLAIVESVRSLHVEEIEPGEPALAVRIGIATGSVVVGDLIGGGASQESAAIGQAPNVAARLQAIAAPNTIVIGAETRRLALDYFEYRDLGEHELKGIAEPVRAWQVTGERVTEVRFEARHSFAATPLVGRAEELALILRRWEQVENGEGQLVLLSGEPGIGKSRLAQAVRERLAGRAHTLVRYQCSPYHTHSALYPVIEQIRRAAPLDADDSPAASMDKIEAWLGAAFEDVSSAAPLFASLLSIDGGGRYPQLQLRPAALKDALLKALAGYLSALARKQPVLLIVEDAHWIDPTTEEALDLVLRGIEDERVLAVVTYRPEYRPRWSSLSHALTLPVVHLPKRETAAMAASVAAGRSLPENLVSEIVAKTDGVPLFVEELTKAVLESGLVVESDGSYRIDGASPDLAIPSTLSDILMARLDRAAPMREVAQVGSCIGRQFSCELLSAVTAFDRAVLNDALAQLEETGLLFRGGTSAGMSYTFKHALVCDAAYRSLLKAERKRIHARIADVLRDSADRFVAAPETLAHHYMEAERYDEAAAQWCLAGEKAGDRYANADAIAHCRSGLGALAKAPRSPQTVQLELVLRIALANCLRITDRYDEALTELAAAEALAAAHNRPLELARIHHMRGNIYYPLGKIESCLAEHQAAYRYAKGCGSMDDEARVLGGLGDAHFLGGRIRQAHEYFEQAVGLARANGLLLTEVAYLPMRAVTYKYCLDYPASLEDCAAVLTLAETVGRARGELISRSTSSWILLDQCEFDQAEEHARKGLEAVEAIGSRRFIPLFNDTLARVRMRAGDRAGALEILEESWNACRAIGVAFVGPVVLGAVALMTTDAARRMESLRCAETILADGCAGHNYFRFYRDAMEVCLRERMWDEAETYASALERYEWPEPSPWAEFFITRTRVLVALARSHSHDGIDGQLDVLRARATRAGLLSALPLVEAAAA